jgi:hypothetical protein
MSISGTVCSDISSGDDDGACCVTKVPHEGETNVIAIQQQSANWKLPRLKLAVNRMNVHGGGTLKARTDEEDDPLISLEWLQPASPSINLNKRILSLNLTVPVAVQLSQYWPLVR